MKIESHERDRQFMRTVFADATVDPVVVARTKAAVRRRAAEMQARRLEQAPLWMSAAISTVMIVLTTPYVWRAFAWFGEVSNVPGFLWQMGFLTWWFLPATVLGAIAVWRHKAMKLDWRQL